MYVHVNGRKSFATEGFNVKIPFISQTYTKALAISFRESHTRTRNLIIMIMTLLMYQSKSSRGESTQLIGDT